MHVGSPHDGVSAAIARCGPLAVSLASATRIGGRAANADAVSVRATPFGVGAAVVDGIGTSSEVVAAAQLAAGVAGIVAAHRGAQAALLAAADTMPDYPGAPNGVAAVASIDLFGRIEVAHVGDAAAWTWSRRAGLTRWTVDQTAGQHVAHVLNNSGLAAADRDALNQHAGTVIGALDDYILTSLVRASIATISWTPLRGAAADIDVLLLTSDGVHKPLPVHQIDGLVDQYAGDDPQALADALVDAAVSVPGRSPDEVADNATAAVLAVGRAR